MLELYGKTYGLIHGHQTGHAIAEKLIKFFLTQIWMFLSLVILTIKKNF